MECEALVEGFKFSIPLYGLIFKTLIADGDSSVYQAILDNNPYKELGIIVGKTECSNHLFRNLDRKLKKISETTEPKLRRNRDFVKIRNIVKSNISKIRKEIKRLIEYRRQQKQPQHCLSKELREDILNVPSHIFGEHKRCKERGTCENFADANKEINYIRYLKTYNIYLKIMTAITYLSSHSDSLFLNVTNNYAELFHSIVCAEIGGKRVFYGARGSYNARIAAAVIQHNTQQVLTELHKNVNDCVPSIIENLEKRRQIKIDRTRESRKINEKPQKRKKNVKGADAYYGPQSQQPDLSPVIFEQLKKKHVEQLFENAQNWEEIECNTRKQSDCELWLSLRKIMLTASNFGPVCRMRPTTSCATNVKNILFPHVIDTAAMKYGRDMEEIAKQDICSKLKIDIKPCGLFVDINNPYLGASPDGLIDEDGLVEIKCPLSAENLTAEEAVSTLPQLKGIFDKRDPNVINRSHRFFYQIQGQLNIARREYCIFAVWTPKSVKTVRLNRDKDFWQNKMLPVLERFYFNCVLPEIIDSRHNRHMPLREPNYIIEAKDKLSKSGNTKRQHVMIASVNEKQNQVIDEKRLKNNISIETNDTVSITETEPDDCIIVSHETNYIPTTDEMASRRRVLDGREISLSSVKENVLPEHSQLNDDSLDLFLRIVAETSRFETQSVHYIEFPQLIRISCSQSVQILGGNCTNHWRCIYFDGTKLYVYDSIPECTYERMASKEKVYISARFPQVVPTDISFEKVQAQPDGTSCGIYAAAFATDIVLGRNPCEETYSNDVDKMRRHFVTIVEGKELLPFPRR